MGDFGKPVMGYPPGKDWYEAFAEGVHELFGKRWPDVLTPEQERRCEEYADARAERPGAERP